MPPEFAAETARRTGKDVMKPTPDVIGEIFGGVRFETAFDEASSAAKQWRPEIVVAEAFDTVGPAVAAEFGVPWHQAGLGPALPEPITRAITDAAAAVRTAPMDAWRRFPRLDPELPATLLPQP